MKPMTSVTAMALLVAVFAGCASASAQTSEKPGNAAGRQRAAMAMRHERALSQELWFTPTMLRQLDLTKEQREQIRRIHHELESKNRPLMQKLQSMNDGRDGRRDRTARPRRNQKRPEMTETQRKEIQAIRNEMMVNRRDANEKILRVLTPAQKEKLKEFQAERTRHLRAREDSMLRGDRSSVHRVHRQRPKHDSQ